MRKVIVNTTPLIALSEIGQLELLKTLYGEIYIPDAVVKEVKTEPAYSEIRKAEEWIHVVPIKDDSQRKVFNSRLHAGEVDVMILAQEENADIVLLDDKLARRTAKYIGLNITGTIGVIVKAKKLGIKDSAAKLINELTMRGLFVSEEVIKMALEEAGE